MEKHERTATNGGRDSCESDERRESTRLFSLRLVNNDDGADNEAIYGHALAHVLASTL